jgi:hypothetical protein
MTGAIWNVVNGESSTFGAIPPFAAVFASLWLSTASSFHGERNRVSVVLVRG